MTIFKKFIKWGINFKGVVRTKNFVKTSDWDCKDYLYSVCNK